MENKVDCCCFSRLNVSLYYCMQSLVRDKATQLEGKPSLGLLPDLGQDWVEVWSPSQAAWLAGGDRQQDIQQGLGHKTGDLTGHRVARVGKTGLQLYRVSGGY